MKFKAFTRFIFFFCSCIFGFLLFNLFFVHAWKRHSNKEQWGLLLYEYEYCTSCFGWWNHGKIEWFGLEWTLKDQLVQLPCHGQGHFSLGQVDQSHIQPIQLLMLGQNWRWVWAHSVIVHPQNAVHWTLSFFKEIENISGQNNSEKWWGGCSCAAKLLSKREINNTSPHLIFSDHLFFH